MIPENSTGTRPPAKPAGSWRLWLWVLAAFALQFAAWTVWFAVAAKHKVAEVPLAPRR
jgi:hypothetical protein